jgi:hypothetical protein
MRSRALFAFVLVLCSVGLASAADDPRFEVTVSCERKAAKGRVICEAELESATGRIAWADVVVMSSPPFAEPLRARIGMTDARARTEHRVRIPVAFVATTTGRGTVSLRARAALCEKGDAAEETCRPISKDGTAEMIVGTDVER